MPHTVTQLYYMNVISLFEIADKTILNKARLACLSIVLLLCLPVEPAIAAAPALIPAPVTVQAGEGEFRLLPDVKVAIAEPQFPGALAAVRLLLGPATGFDFAQATPGQTAQLRITHASALAAEAYHLRVDEQGIHIEAANDAGVFYALQTLRQLLPPAIYSTSAVQRDWTLSAVDVKDVPRFGWRGMHLDVGRHFMPVEFVKKFIDVLAVHKLNSFHWHLTEDQGWRIEIKRYPKLTEVGSQRAQTVVGNTLFVDDEELVYDGIPHGGFYTQDEVRDIVAYAAQRHINVVPEIEFPGHAQAAIAAYPELGNTGEQLKVMEKWGINKNTIKPSEETLAFYRNVLAEVIDLFPSEYIHIGGDEAPKDQWEEGEYAQQRMKELGLADADELQSWLIQQMDDFLSAHGRKLVGWDEIMQGGLSSNATVMSWRGVRPGIRAAEAGHDVVMAPTSWTYFDYYQADKSIEPLAIGSYTPLAAVYDFDPAPANLPEAVRQHILGAQGQLWTEYMKTPDHVEYMAFPRAVALAEVVWSPQVSRDYQDFQQRLPIHLERLDELGVNYRPPGNDELTLSGKFSHFLFSTGMAIYFWLVD